MIFTKLHWMFSGTTFALAACLLSLTLLSACGGKKKAPIDPDDLPELKILTEGLPSVTVDFDYSQIFRATGGTGIYDWTVDVGALPDGLELDLLTGVLDGTPTLVGDFLFTIKVVSGPLELTQDFSIRVGNNMDDPMPLLERISVATDGITPANGHSGSAALSPDGRFVAFSSFADNLAVNLPGGDINRFSDVFIRDLDCETVPMTSERTTSLVSMASDGVTQGDAASWLPTISAMIPTAEGNLLFLTYLSEATNLVPGDTNDFRDVMLTVIRVEGAPACTLVPIHTTRINVSATGEEADGTTGKPFVNATADFVAYSSRASNLVQADANGRIDVFAHRIEFVNRTLAVGPPRRMSTLTRFPARLADLFSENTIGNSGLILELDSQAGRKVEILSGTGTGQTRTIEANDATTFIISEPWVQIPDGTSVYRVFSTSTADGSNARISADGSVIGFNLGGSFGADDRNFSIEAVIKRFDLDDLASVSLAGHATPANGQSNLMGLNDSGTLALFTSLGNNLVEDDTNRANDLFVRDTPVRTTSRVHVANDGSEANGAIGAFANFQRFESAAFSNSGNLIVYESSATNLTEPVGDFNGFRDVFFYNRLAATTTQLSIGMDSVATSASSFDVTISLDGTVVVFSSDADNIFANDDNNSTDLFLFRTGVPAENPSFLTREIADGTVGKTVDARLQTIGGGDPLSFAVQDGQLPPGVGLDPATGRLTGLPTEPGDYIFTIVVMDSSRPLRSNSRTYTMTVKASQASEQEAAQE